MQSKRINPLLSWWLTPKLPYEHCVIRWRNEDTPLTEKLRVYFKHYVFHPVKRRVAKYYLVFLKKFFGLKVVGITGSAGKTTTKDMLYSILKRNGKTVASYKNIDPVYNIPTTIFKCTPSTKYLILEMGVEYKGEMDYYLWLANPDVGVITNISATHTQFFGDVGGVFKEKSKLVKLLSSKSTAVLYGGDKFLKKLGPTLKCKVVWFGMGTQVMSTNEKIVIDGTKFDLIFDKSADKKIRIKIPILGRQFLKNALAAATVAKVFGVEMKQIKKGLEKYSLAPHRMQVMKRKKGAVIIDDTYNNNPEAAKKAIDALYDYPGYYRDRVIVFADMLELGSQERKQHQGIGEYLKKKIYPLKLVCIGPASKYTALTAEKYIGKSRVVHYDNWEKAVDEVKSLSNKRVVMLVKGSRSMQLDKLIAAL